MSKRNGRQRKSRGCQHLHWRSPPQRRNGYEYVVCRSCGARGERRIGEPRFKWEAPGDGK